MSDNDSRIVITGVGIVSSLGIGRDAFWQGLALGQSGIKPITLFDTSQTRSKMAGEITDFYPEEILGSKGLRNLDRTTKLALCASKLALNDANFEISEKNENEIGVTLGSAMGSVWSMCDFDKNAILYGPKSVNPALFANTVINSAASQISIRFNIKGFNTTISGGFLSSLEAIRYAISSIKNGRAASVLVGGAEELCEQTFRGFHKIGFLAGSRENRCEISAPFDRRRNGAIMGEGAAIFLLEDLKSALTRNAHIYAEITGFGTAVDIGNKSWHKYNPYGAGAYDAINQALENANLSPQEIQYTSLSANSALDGDICEARALNSIFERVGRQVVGSSTKSMIGETFSAGGAFQIASGLLALAWGILPPTINFKQNDRRCNIDHIPNAARLSKINNVLVSCISPLGDNAALVLTKK